MLQHFAGNGKNISDDIKKFVEDSVFANNQYMFVDDKEHRDRGYCSHCHADVDLTLADSENGICRQRHNEIIRCPDCGYPVAVKHKWRGYKSIRNKGLFNYFEKSTLDPNIITCRCIFVERDYYNEQPDQTSIEYNIDSFYVFIAGKGGKMMNHFYGEKSYWYNTENEMKVNVGPRYYAYTGSYGMGGTTIFDISYESIRKAIKKTPFSHICWDYYENEETGDGAVKLFDQFAKYPSIEYVTKIGLGHIITERLRGSASYGVLNLRKTRIRDILRRKPTKADACYIKKHGKNIRYSDLKAWQKAKNINVSLEEIVKSGIGCKWKDNIENIIQGIKTEKIIKYIVNSNNQIYDYFDYIDQCRKLGYDLSNKSTLFPKNLEKAHSKASAQIKYKKNKELEDKWNKRHEKMVKKYEFAALGYKIVIPQRAADLIAEGAAMSNCVGGYMERMASGSTDIMFIRKNEDLEKSFVTMEVCKNVIIQVRAKYNKNIDEDTEKFVELFKKCRLETKRRKTA